MNGLDGIIEKLRDVIKRSAPKTSAYDTQATVTRVEGDTAWVHIPGGVDETPVRMTISAKAGDTVQVRVGGGRAWITGNATAPPTDDTASHKAITLASTVNRFVQTLAGDVVRTEEVAVQAGKTAVIAMQSADGKSTVYHSATEPTGGEYQVGDTWFNESEGYAIYTWDGTDWIKEELGEDAIADLSITNAKIANATIQSGKIAGLDVGKLTGGYIDAGHINVGAMKVGDLQNDVGYITSGDVGKWYTGTAMTYTDSSPHIYTNSGISNAIPGDMYLNTSTDNVYLCTTGGTPSVAQWTYSTNIGGDDGKGIQSTTSYKSGGTTYYIITYTDGTTTTLSIDDGEDITSRYVTTITGRSGVTVHDANDTSNYANVNSNGMQVVKSGSGEVAAFGTTARIGTASDKHVSYGAGYIQFYKGTDSFANSVGRIGYGLDFNDEPYVSLDSPYGSYQMILYMQDGLIGLTDMDGYINGNQPVFSVGKNANGTFISGIPTIDSGRKSSISVSGTDHVSGTISFNKTFSSAPIVVVGFQISPGGSNPQTFGGMACSAHSITTTGFTYHISNNTSTARTPDLNWIAIGT